MDRRRKLEHSTEDEEEKVHGVVARWSIKRIAIALVLLFLLVASIYYYYSLKQFSSNANITNEKRNKPQIELPTKDKVNTIIEDAKESLEKIDTNDVVSSQPQIQKIINDLQELTTSSRSAKDIVCNAVCK